MDKPQDDYFSDSVEEPPATEIRKGLRRILESRYFKNATEQAKYLVKIIDYALKNKPIKEQDLLDITRSSPKDESNKARQSVLVVRKKLSAYYANEGRDDLVKIDLLPGRSYKVHFSWNESAYAITSFKIGLQLKWQLTTRSLADAAYVFKLLTMSRPRWKEAHLERAETLLLCMLVNDAVGLESGEIDAARMVREHLRKALELDPTCYRAALIGAAYHLMENMLGTASKGIEKSINTNQVKASQSLWYAAFLVKTGAIAEAVEIAKTRVNVTPPSAGNLFVYALFLYLARHFREALEVLDYCIASDGLRPLKYLLSGLIRLELEEYEQALFCFKVSSQIPFEDLYDLHRKEGELSATNELHPGFLALSLALGGHAEEAKATLATRRSSKVQAAVGWMGLGRSKRAIAYLCASCNFRAEFDMVQHVLVNLAPMMPLFDRLHGQHDFVRLLNWLSERRYSAKTDVFSPNAED